MVHVPDKELWDTAPFSPAVDFGGAHRERLELPSIPAIVESLRAAIERRQYDHMRSAYTSHPRGGRNSFGLFGGIHAGYGNGLC